MEKIYGAAIYIFQKKLHSIVVGEKIDRERYSSVQNQKKKYNNIV